MVGDALVGIRPDLWNRYDLVTANRDNAEEDRVVCEYISDLGHWIYIYPVHTLGQYDINNMVPCCWII